MAPFFPVYIRRSDGKTLTAKAAGSGEPNEPLAEQLDTSPNAQGICDYYRECLPGETKEVDWRRKLAGMLIREIGGAEQKDKNFILAALPESYRLFEHVRCKVSEVEGKNPKPTKHHAAGGNERQDAYLYGHPQGRKKRYRSPAEFFPHLLWLSTDEHGDPNNCSCKFCSPEELESDDKPKLPPKETKQPVIRPDSQPKSTSAAARAADNQSQGTPSAAQSIGPSPLPRFRRNEQRLDAQYNQFLFRPGELIWFQRGPAWGLGVVAQRYVSSGNPSVHQYLVQPLSHPLSHPQAIVCTQAQIRAWLSWSPPPCISPALNATSSSSGKAQTYDTVDWQGYLNGRYGPGDAEVDGSILAAKHVETTYTLFDLIDSKTSTKGSGQTSEIHYNGMFLGAEKFWLGDPLRIRNSANLNDMMVLHAIIERQSPLDASRAQLTLVGDVYSQGILQLESGAEQKSNESLPPRVREELAARNEITSHAQDSSRRFTYFWKLESKAAKFSVADIKGRWYESSLLMPIISPAEYEADRLRGELGDVGMWMNGHGDCNKYPNVDAGTSRPADVRLKKREDAFARAVPATFKISKGLDDPKTVPAASATQQPQAAVKVERPSVAQPLPASQRQQQQRPETLQTRKSPPATTAQRKEESPMQQQPQQQQQSDSTTAFHPFLASPQAPQHSAFNFDSNSPRPGSAQPDHNNTENDNVGLAHAPHDGAFDQYMDFGDDGGDANSASSRHDGFDDPIYNGLPDSLMRGPDEYYTE